MLGTIAAHPRLLAGLLGLFLAAWLIDARADDPARVVAPFEDPFEDPLPIQRILLPKDRVAAELQRAKQGTLIRLSRSEFEQRVRQAAVESRHSPEPPRLIEANYRARLIDERLDDNALRGTGEWKIAHSSVTPGLLPLESMQIALKQARWPDNRPAVIGFLDPRPQSGLALLVESAGEQALAVEWSSRGVPQPGELRFDLAVPASPIANLELELPIHLRPIFPQDDVICTGPEPVDDEGKNQAWHVSFGGLDHLEISVRPAATTGQPPPPVQSAIAARHDLSTGQVLSQFAFDFKALRRDLVEMLVEHDPDLTVTDVSAFNLESWRALNGVFGGKRRVAVRFREQVVGGQLRVNAVSALPFTDATPWTCPAMQIVGVIPRGESIRLQISQDLRLMEWRTGTFRLLRQEAAADLSQVFFLESSHLPENQTTLTRPVCRFRSTGTEFRVQQKNVWEIGTDRSVFESAIHLQCDRGVLNRFSLRLPTGWDLQQFESAIPDLNPIWTLTEGANPQLQVELPKGLQPGGEARLLVRLYQSSPNLAPGVQQAIAIPDVMPLGARSRRGELDIRISSAFQSFTQMPSVGFDEMGPTPLESTDRRSSYSYRFHGQPPAGPILVRRQTPRLAATVESTISIVADSPAVTTRLTVKPEMGAIARLILSSSEPLERASEWRTVRGDRRILSVQPIPLGSLFNTFGATSLFGPLVDMVVSSRSNWWLMTFSQPIESEIVFERTDEIPDPAAGFYRVPLIGVVGTASTKGKVIVKTGGLSNWRIETAGLDREHVRQSVKAPQTQWSYAAAMPTLVLHRLAEAETGPIQIDHAELHIVANSSEDHRCLLRLRVQSNNQRRLEVGLPSAAEILKATVSGRILSGDQISTDVSGKQAIHALPLSTGSNWQRIEVLFSLPARTWTFSTNLAVPLPELPTPPSDLRVIWHLPPGVSPADGAAAIRQPGGPDAEPASIAWWLYGDNHDVRERPPSESERKSAAGIKNPATRTFQQFLSSSGGIAEKPILDSLALDELGLLPTTPVAGSSWDALGLVFVSTPGGNVLTTPRQLSLWRADAMTTHSLPTSIAAAIGEASRYGRDPAGRFRSVDDWLDNSVGTTSTLLAELGGDAAGWTLWEAPASSLQAEFSVVNTRHVVVSGWIIAGLLGCIGVLAMGRLGRLGTLLLLIWMVGCGVLLLVLPTAWRGVTTGPMAAALVVAVLSSWIRKPRLRHSKTVLQRSTSRSRIVPASAVTILLILVGGWVTRAAVPDGYIVYLLPATGANQEPKTVLAPPELMDRLSLMAKPRLALSESVIVRTRYIGRSGSTGLAEFEGHFDIVTFGERATISLPLSGVRLREALLDGAAAYPKPSDADRTTFEIRGRGEHKLVLTFSAAIASNGPDSEVRFSSVESAICELEFTQAEELAAVRAVNWRGAQVWTDAGKKLMADLGRTKSVHVRWRQSGNPGVAQIKVQEASVWDIDATSATLYSAFDYRITQGNISSLRVQLPPNVEVAKLEIRPETNPIGSPPSWVRDWSIAGNRLLKVDLQAPLTGAGRLLLELVPVRPVSARPNLQYPHALDTSESEVYLSYRLRGLESPVDIERKGMTEFSADSFLRDIWQKIGAERNPLPVNRAFRRGKGEQPQVRPALIPAPALKEISQELIWRLDPRTANVEGFIHWSAAGAPTTFVEWEVPPSIAILDVRGLSVHSWHRTGNRVFAWLREPNIDGALVWNGSMPRSDATAEMTTFEPPSIRAVNAAKQSTVIRLRIPEGWIISSENLATNGSPVPPIASREFAYELVRPGPDPKFQLRSPQSGVTTHLFTTVEMNNRQLSAKTAIKLSLRRERPHVFRLRISNADGWNLDLRFPASCKATPLDSTEWLVEVVPRDVDVLMLEVDMTRRVDSIQTLLLPSVVVDTGEHSSKVEQQLSLRGTDVGAAEMWGFKRKIQASEPNRSSGPDAASHLNVQTGRLWLADDATAQARVIAVPQLGKPVSPVRILLADVEAAPFAGRWIYRMSIDLHHVAGAKLYCVAPGGATLEGCAIEGDLVEGSSEFFVPLPVEEGTRLVQMWWSTPLPHWDLPTFISGMEVVPDRQFWRVNASPTERFETTASLSSAAYNLRKAEAAMAAASEATLNLSDQSRTRLAASALRWLRSADIDLARPRDEIARERGPGGIPLAEWATNLRQRANSMQVGPSKATPLSAVPPLREATNEKLPFADAFRVGIPIRWEGAAPKDLRRQSIDSQTSLPMLARVGLLLLTVAMFGFLVFMLPHSTRFEQMAMAGMIGLVVFGFPIGLLCLALIASAIMLRLAWVGNRALRWVNG